MQYITPWDFIVTPVIIGIILLVTRKTQEKHISENAAYAYYVKGMIAKIIGAIGLGIIYVFYYGGGDTLNYWVDAGRLVNLIFHDFSCGFKLLMGDDTSSLYFCFDRKITGMPLFFPRDLQAYTVSRLTAIPHLLTINSFFACSVLMAAISYTGVWRLYLVFCREYPQLMKEFAIAILFIPSLLFWGSGILKDTWTLAAVGWLTYGVYNILLSKQGGVIKNVVYVVIAASIIISIKPYIFVALMPGVLIWVVFGRISQIGNPVMRILAAPIFIMVGLVGGSFLFSQTSGSLGAYGDLDATLEKAVVTQEDLKRAAYDGNSFDIGSFEPTIPGILSKAPVAIFAGLFRPTLLDVNNVVMLISAIENTFLMLFFLFNMVRIGPFGYVRYVLSEPLSLFSVIFSVFFAFAVGLTTSNFGSLVRYRIPAIPFFLGSLYITRYQKSGGSRTLYLDDFGEGNVASSQITDHSSTSDALPDANSVARSEAKDGYIGSFSQRGTA